MGVVLKFIIFLIGGLFFLTLLLGVKTVGKILRLFFGPKRSSRNTYQSSGRQTQNSEPETQEDRIISYQKKNFESIQAEDVDFEEVKDR